MQQRLAAVGMQRRKNKSKKVQHAASPSAKHLTNCISKVVVKKCNEAEQKKSTVINIF